MTLSRRSAIGLIAAAPAAPALANRSGFSAGAFTHGVASGDPLASAVLLWTRFVPADGQRGLIGWEVAEDAGFSRVVRSGRATASPARDFTVKADVTGLKPGRAYHYRFLAANGASAAGRTVTLPSGGAPRLGVGVFSCSNYPFGYFNAYAHAAAREDLDLTFHLGDYIYEYPRGRYPSAALAMPGRVLEPPGETITLADYRARHATYHNDEDLQALRAARPLIAVWDDHESANDTWKGGAQEHDPKTEGDWTARRRAAQRAYFEWLPVRPRKPGDFSHIARSFQWGDLATLIMLDTRMTGRDQQLEYDDAVRAIPLAERKQIEAVLTGHTAYLDPKRSILGAPQEAWLSRQLAASKAKGTPWQLIGQQLLMGYLRMPADAEALTAPLPLPDWTRKYIGVGVMAAQLGLPLSMDTWTGYPACRERVLKAFEQHGTNVIVTAGDSHNAWAFELGKRSDGAPVAVEFGGTSVTSPGYEDIGVAPPVLESAFLKSNPEELRFCDIQHRGYLTVTLTPEQAQAEFLHLRTIKERSGEMDVIRRASVPARPSGGGRLTI